MTLVEFIDNVLETIKAGWCQRYFSEKDENGKVCYCLSGACSTLFHRLEYSRYDELLYHFVNIFAQNIGHHSLIKYNDTLGRTQQEVIELLEKMRVDALKLDSIHKEFIKIIETGQAQI
jgi:hypothetical protein